MRAIACSLIIGLVPVTALAETIEYTFSGSIDNEAAAGFPTNWAGPGPQPTTFQMTFDVDTLAPTNSVSYTFGPSSLGPSINSIDAELTSTNVTFSLDGTTVYKSATGDFGFSGGGLGEFSFIGGSAGASAGEQGYASVFFIPDFGLGTTLESALMGSSDPLGLILNNSTFSTDTADPSIITFGDSTLGAVMNGSGKAVSVSVPEPGTLALFPLAGLALALAHRRRAFLSRAFTPSSTPAGKRTAP